MREIIHRSGTLLVEVNDSNTVASLHDKGKCVSPSNQPAAAGNLNFEDDITKACEEFGITEFVAGKELNLDKLDGKK